MRKDEIRRLSYDWGGIAENALQKIGEDKALTRPQREEFLRTAQVAATLALGERLEVLIDAMADIKVSLDRILAVDVHQGRTH